MISKSVKHVEDIDLRENLLLDLMNFKDWDIMTVAGSRRSQVEKDAAGDALTNVQRRKLAEKDYLVRTKEMVLLHSRLVQEQAKLAALKGQDKEPAIFLYKKRRMRIETSGQPKVFGGDLDDLYEGTGFLIPRVVTSCVSAIRKQGMRHQGIFRIGGNHVSIHAN